MKKKMFFISDIHGHYKEMIDALTNAGFNENDKSHLLVVLGDIGDRGDSVLSVYEYLKELVDKGSAIVIRGNHETMLIDFLEGSNSPFNYMNNGMDETIADFWHRTAPFESWCLLEGQCEMNLENYAKWANICRKDIMEEYPWLLDWLKSLPRYFESKNYIGVHGAIDTEVENWHYPHCSLYNLNGWDALEFDDGSFFGKTITNTDKTIIIGHFGTAHLRKIYNYSPNKNLLGEYDILKRKDGRVIAIDATTCLSKKVNVLIIDDEEIINDEIK